jgi:hypothetical protein
MKLKAWNIGMILILLAGLQSGFLTGCGATALTGEYSPSDVAASPTLAESGQSASAALDDSYEGALAVSSQLALGSLLLEGTGDAITLEQAQKLLLLWQIVQSGSLQSEAETTAVLNQIEGAMTPGQLSAIAAMQLTSEDMTTWAQDQGVNLAGSGPGTGRVSLPEGMTEEETEEMRAARGSGEGGPAPPEGMEGVDREAMRATAEASGMARPDGAGAMGAGQLAALVGPLVEMLSNLVGS